MKKTSELPTELGRFMRRWRKDQEWTIDRAAQEIGVVKSTWSQLERGLRTPETETLLLMERKMGVTMDELARMAGIIVRVSQTVAERSRRVAALAEGDPRMGVLIDLLPELSPEQIDTLVSLVETMKAQKVQGVRRINAG